MSFYLAQTFRLFDGEVIVSSQGIYTFAHLYHLPRSTRSVVLVGTNHVGDPEYFQTINDLLARCDLVIYEDSGGGGWDTREREEASRSALYGWSLEEAFAVSPQLYFICAQRALGLPAEGDSFDYQQPHWVSGEADFLTEEQQQTLMTELEARIQAIPADRKKEIVDFVRTEVGRADRGEYTARNLGDGFVFLWSDPQLVEAVSETIGKPRDRHCLEFFDRLVTERDPKTVGIKFGAGHTAFQRRLLEERGYVREKSLRLCNIRF